MRKPDSVKNTDTPTYPPGMNPNPAWNSTTNATARARTPSSAGCRGWLDIAVET